MNTQLTFHQPTLASRARVRACRFLVSKGAEVDALGGSFNPTFFVCMRDEISNIAILQYHNKMKIFYSVYKVCE